MSAPNDQKRPIIVKRHAAHDDEHGGQWKVAYADFVTAMMAFFLIMWLLASASQSERVIIAKYFTSSSLFDMPAGNGVLEGGKSVMQGIDAKPQRGQPDPRDKAGKGDKPAEAVTDKAPEKAADKPQARPDTATLARDRAEHQRFEAIKAELERMMVSGELQNAANNLEVAMTPDGLRIQIFDRDGEPMFAPGGSEPLPRLKMILGVIGQVLSTVRNNVILSGHTDSQPLRKQGYSNWELSADRANAVRRSLESGGLAQGRVVRVEGRASADPLLPQTPADPRNRRIAVTILRGEPDSQALSARP